jgi:hypothetical protein
MGALAASAKGGTRMDYQRIARITGWLWIVTFITSIPARFIFYAPVSRRARTR